MKQLIVAADDFGLTGSINKGIVKAVREGIVTSVNLMPSGEAFDDALNSAKELGLAEAGAHLALTETAPVSDASRIPTIVAKDGRFYGSRNRFVPRLLLGMLDLDEVYVELKAQLDSVISSGIRVTNLSSHEHMHMLPGILDIFVKLAREYDVPAIRYPREDISRVPLSAGKIYKSIVMSVLGGPAAKMIRSSGLRRPDRFLGFHDSGALTEEALLGMLASLRDGTTELVCHPGLMSPEVLDRYPFHKNCEDELFALTSRRVKKSIADNGIRLIRYGEYLLS
ncbi:MAG: ChbG/HpnK family deacetylase [Candidatus Omnitrophica bacterium]|nr:ChbG/HpnK family deacetylase [Candidatus Omnitrophota bacterium]MCM8791139.1 ChbG/HpnK family deacetylase [Candidatus Omnitrophota bacterium]